MNSTSHLHLTGTEKADRLPGQRTSETLLLLTGSQKDIQFKLVYSTQVAESRLHQLILKNKKNVKKKAGQIKKDYSTRPFGYI